MPIYNPPSGSTIESVTKNEEGKITSISIGGSSIDTSGTPADGSVTTAKFAAANIDGAAGTPSARSLSTSTNFSEATDTEVASRKATKTYVENAIKLAGFTQKPVSGNFITPQYVSKGTFSPGAGNINTMFLLPFDLIQETEFDRIGMDLTIVGTGVGLSFRVGVYADDGTGYAPKGKALVDAGEISALEVLGDKLKEITLKLAAGRYWTAFAMQGTFGTAPTVRAINPLAIPWGSTDLGESNYHALKQAEVKGALPEIGTLSVAGSNPLVGLRVK